MLEKEELAAMVRAVQNGQSDALSELYGTFYHDIYGYVMKNVYDEELANDITQNTFLEIIQTIISLRDPSAFIAWSRKVAYHQCTAYFRKNRELLEDKIGESVFDSLVEEREEYIPDEALCKAELRQVVHAMIRKLPEEQRTAIMLYYFDELSVKHIAEIQGVTEGTVKSRLNYGRKAIKQCIEAYENIQKSQ